MALVLLLPSAAVRAQRADAAPAKLFPLAAVRLLGGPFSEAVEANRRYMLDLDPDRLLAPLLREAGLPPQKPPYGNWESGGLDGHTAGHYLQPEDLDLRRSQDRIVGHEDFAAWNIDPARWLAL